MSALNQLAVSGPYRRAVVVPASTGSGVLATPADAMWPQAQPSGNDDVIVRLENDPTTDITIMINAFTSAVFPLRIVEVRATTAIEVVLFFAE